MSADDLRSFTLKPATANAIVIALSTEILSKGEDMTRAEVIDFGSVLGDVIGSFAIVEEIATWWDLSRQLGQRIDHREPVEVLASEETMLRLAVVLRRQDGYYAKDEHNERMRDAARVVSGLVPELAS